MDVRMTRVSWPATGTPSAMAGMAMRASQPPGSAVSEGSGPEAGSTCSIEENSRIMSTASQNDGVAMQAMENTRMIWSGHRSRYKAEITPRITAMTTPMMRPKNVNCNVTGRASPMRSATEALFAP